MSVGFLRSLWRLNREANTYHRTWEPVGQMRYGRGMIRTATAQLAEQNALTELAHQGIPAAGSIIAVRDTGSAINGLPIVEIDMLVTVTGRPPYPVTVRTLVPIVRLGSLRQGGTLSVRIDPGRPARAAVAWDQTPPS